MKKRNGILNIFMAMLLFALSFPRTAMANSAEPPGFVILVSGAPEDLTITMQTTDPRQEEPLVLHAERQGWEAYYRYFYYADVYDLELEGTALVVEGGGYDFRLILPTETFRMYNNLLTLDLEAQTLVVGQPFWRVPLLVSLRVISTLVIEGAIFWLFGYREKRSWIVFLVVNLLTQGGLNIALTNPVPGGSAYWEFGLVILEVLVLIAEIVLYRWLLQEHKKGRGIGFAVVANMASLFLGAMLLTYLPW